MIDTYRRHQANRSDELLLRVLRTGRQSKTALAHSTGLSVPAVYKIAKNLIGQNMVVETNEDQGGGRGRKGRVLALNPGFRTAIGLELTDISVTGCVLDFSGVVRHETRLELPSMQEEHVLASVLAVVDTLVPLAKRWGPLQGIGIGAHGVVGDGQILRFPGNTEWKPMPLERLVVAHTGMDCLLELRLYTATCGELLCGGHFDEVGPIVYFNAGPGNGFGVGIISAGAALQGTNGLQGQFGHFLAVPHGKRCPCGSHGCLVTVASPVAVQEQACEALQHTGVESSLRQYSHVTFPDILAEARREDKLCIGLLEDAAEHLGKGFSYIINLLNPALIVIGGAYAEGGHLVLNAIRQTARKHAVSNLYTATRWEVSALQVNPAAAGAASLLFDKYFGRHSTSSL